MKHFLLLLSIFIPFLSSAQNNSHWAFGHNAGLDFSTSPPSVFQTGLQCFEGGSVCFSDASGNILFYSNGNDVWDAGNNIMPNGSGILGNGAAPGNYPCSSAQGTVAAQSVANPKQYYLFTLDAAENVTPGSLGKLRYSVIDMSLNGGWGDVVPAQKNIVLEDSLSEKMVLVRGEGCNYWLLVHHLNKPTYYAFKINAGGISTLPVVSSGSIAGGSGVGMMAASPDGSRITLSNFEAGFEMTVFNRATGEVSDAVAFSLVPYGMCSQCFSADNTKLYARRGMALTQYDATLFPNIAAMEAGSVVIAANTSLPFGYMRRGPDGKIYIANYMNSNIAVINAPNAPGLTCNYAVSGIPLPAFAQFANPAAPALPYYGLGLGQDVLSIEALIDTAKTSRKDTILCPHTSITLEADTGREHYLWNNGTTNSSWVADQPGTYWVHSWRNCALYADTFIVRAADIGVWGLGNDTVLCPGTALLLDAYQPDITDYTWSDGSKDTRYTVTTDGVYAVAVKAKGCTFTDTVNITVLAPSVQILQQDTSICTGHTLLLHVVAYPASSYRWNNGSTKPVFLVTGPGSYRVAATNECGTYSDSVTINMILCTCRSFVPNAFSPNADGHNDFFEIQLDCPAIVNFQLSIFNRYGQLLFQANKPDERWDGTFKGKPLDAGVYFYYMKYIDNNQRALEKKGDLTLIR